MCGIAVYTWKNMKEAFISLTIPLRVYLVITAVMGLITLIMFGVDKLLSKAGIDLGTVRYTPKRISERTLLTLCFFGGSLGGMLGMLIFRHKTLHLKFRILVPLFLLIWVLIGLAVIEYGPAVTDTIKSMI